MHYHRAEDARKRIQDCIALDRLFEKLLSNFNGHQVQLDIVVFEGVHEEMRALLHELLVLLELLLRYILEVVLHGEERLLSVLPVAVVALLADYASFFLKIFPADLPGPLS